MCGQPAANRRNIMKTSVKMVAPWLAAAAIGTAIGLAPLATAAPAAPSPTPAPYETGPDPLVPYGTDPRVPFRLGYINPNHDEGDFTNGERDLPF
jgi:hypothetical protein